LDTREDFLWFGEKADEEYWIDPETPEVKGLKMGLCFLTFIGNDDETITIS
jgi:hypothetical protein